MKKILLIGFILTTISTPLLAQPITSDPHQIDKSNVTNLVNSSNIDINQIAKISRDKTTKKAILQIATAESWRLYSGTSPDKIDFTKPILEGEGSGEFPLNIDNNRRTYFGIVTQHGKGIIAENHLPMRGGYNFRDLGGIRTKDGHHIKWDKLIRSDELGNLTDNDLTYLSSLPLITVVDFRRTDEITALPDRLPKTVKNDVQLNIVSANLKPGSNSIEDVRDWMIFINEELVTDKTIQQSYKDFFKLVQNEKNTPLLFHCSAGKDRTGMAAALILYVLGVDENIIFQEHMLSNQYLKEKYAPTIAKQPELQPQFEVQEAYFRRAFDRIKKDHGSIENYLTTVLDVDIAKMRAIYLY
ncbi:tyrosine-protein phosphatase [Orbaceae bacterium ESL0721]|nr:tyrosine-protein phosphatase [Orbaceae bacterium ESL0721]